jgi:hypothetical protein
MASDLSFSPNHAVRRGGRVCSLPKPMHLQPIASASNRKYPDGLDEADAMSVIGFNSDWHSAAKPGSRSICAWS